MSNSLLDEFEDEVAELRGRLPALTGESRRNVEAELNSLTELLDLLAILRQPGGGDGAGTRVPETTSQAPEAIASANRSRQEA